MGRVILGVVSGPGRVTVSVFGTEGVRDGRPSLILGLPSFRCHQVETSYNIFIIVLVVFSLFKKVK